MILSEMEIKTPEIASLEQPLRKLVRQLKEEITGYRYGLIVGDDISGRVPTLVLGRVINSFYEKQGHPSIPILFIKGFRGEKTTVSKYYDTLLQVQEERQLGKRLEEAGRNLNSTNRRALLITEYILSGKTVENLSDFLARFNIENCDIAALWIQDFETIPGTILKGKRLFFSQQTTSPPQIYGVRKLTGVEWGQFRVEAIKGGGIKEQVNRAREDVKTMAEGLLKELSPSINLSLH